MSGAARRILVVDDEGTIREACRRILEEDGHAVRVEPRGEGGLDALREERFDAVVLDLKMPGLGGMETLRRIRSEDPDLPVVVITGFATDEMKRECVGWGGVAWVAKPFDPDGLLQALAEVLS